MYISDRKRMWPSILHTLLHTYGSISNANAVCPTTKGHKPRKIIVCTALIFKVSCDNIQYVLEKIQRYLSCNCINLFHTWFAFKELTSTPYPHFRSYHNIIYFGWLNENMITLPMHHSSCHTFLLFPGKRMIVIVWLF